MSSAAETMKIHLKDVGADLVANLNLLSEYARAVTNVGEWWRIVKDDLTSKSPRLLPPHPGSPSENQAHDMWHSRASSPQPGPDHFTQWMDMKQGFQEYYNVVCRTSFFFSSPPDDTRWMLTARVIYVFSDQHRASPVYGPAACIQRGLDSSRECTKP